MGIFSKAPLDPDVDQALHGGDINYIRKCIAKAQPFIRDTLLPDENLDLIFYESYTGDHTVVVTNQRVLVIRNRFSGLPKELVHACTAAQIRGARFGPTPTGAYVVALEFHRAMAAIKFNTHQAAHILTQAVNDLRAGG